MSLRSNSELRPRQKLNVVLEAQSVANSGHTFTQMERTAVLLTSWCSCSIASIWAEPDVHVGVAGTQPSTLPPAILAVH